MEIGEIIKFLKEKKIRVQLANATELDIKAPKGVVNKEIITLLKAHKNDLIAYYSSLHETDDVIKKVATENKGYPLSYAQKKMWILSQVEERSIAYTSAEIFQLPYHMDKDFLEKSIHATINRHESLRTIFKENEQGEPLQWILPIEAVDYKLHYTDLRSRDDREAYIKNYVKNDQKNTFNLSKEIQLRTHLFQLEDELFTLYHLEHHITSDGVSMDVIIRDVLEYYRAFLKNDKVHLPALRIQYKDYAIWQLEKMASVAFKSHENFWREKLSGKLPVLDLPNQKTRPKILTYNGTTLGTYVPLEITAALKQFSAAHGGTIFIGVLTVWKILFYKYTKKTDIIIGTPIAGRDHVDLEDQIGIFMNLLPLRSTLHENDNFIQTFTNVKNVAFNSSNHQAYPIDKVLEDLNLYYDPSRNPLYDVMLSFHNTAENSVEEFKLAAQEIDEIVVEDHENSKLDMLINFREIGEYLYFNINYNTDLYDEVVIKQLMKDYKIILKELLKNPETTIQNIDFEAEVKNTIREKNKTKFKMKIK